MGEPTRRYDPPKLLTNATNSIIKHHKPSNSQHEGSIPTSQQLSTIKADLENMLTLAETRTKDLKKDLHALEKNTKGSASSGKNIGAVMEKMRIKHEPNDHYHHHSVNSSTDNDDIDDADEGHNDTNLDMHHSFNIPKNELSRQAALETIRRRRRREETESSDERRSESPRYNVKLKKLDGIPSMSQEDLASPPPQSSSASPLPPSSSQSSRPKSDVKKVKKSSSGRGHHSDSKHSKHNAKQKVQPEEEVDFVRVKAKDQIPITTFWSTLEPYFRNLTEEDREFLMQKSDTGKPYLIPPLGQHYLERWAEEDQAVGIHTTDHKPKHHHGHAADNHHAQDDFKGGSLTDRLISSLVKEDILPEDQAALEDEEDAGENDEQGDENGIPTSALEKSYNARTILELSNDLTDDIVDFEERLKRELRYAGLFGDEDVDWNNNEDDEICAELRTLGRELKEQVKTNEYRKKRLLEVVDCQLQFEQYRQVLDTLDNQVEQGYLKRFRPQKAKKRKTTGPRAVLSENAVYAMEKRKTWIKALGGIFKDKNMNMPTSSIYEQQPPEEDDPTTTAS